MDERPIAFTAPLVLAIRRDLKTQTRRLMRPQPRLVTEDGVRLWRWENGSKAILWRYDEVPPDLPSPYGVPGDLLWVREAHFRFGHWEPVPGKLTPKGRQKWRFVADRDGCRFDAPSVYAKAMPRGGTPAAKALRTDPAWYWRNPRFMPKAFARTWLRVTEVRAERLQDISEEDARAEGVEPCEGSYVLGLWKVWDEINAGRAIWASDPWVWAVSFERIKEERT